MKRMASASSEREVEWASAAFLETRLRDKASFDWAARLNADREAERNAIRSLLKYPMSDLEEPYKSAWSWICEAWDEPSRLEDQRYEMADAIRRGGDPSAFVGQVVELVRPRLVIEAAPLPKRRATMVAHLIHLKLDAERIVSLDELELNKIDSVELFSLLATRLASELSIGLFRARRIGSTALYFANWIERVYSAKLTDANGEQNDPDEFRGGFAPLTKLLYEVLIRLRDLAPDLARKHTQGWARQDGALFRRLWAAAARDCGLVRPTELAAFLNSLDPEEFWSIGRYPEIAELRGKRFVELENSTKNAVEARLLRLPPAKLFPSRLTQPERTAAQRSWARRELKRIELGGGQFSKVTQSWISDFEQANEPVTQLTSVTSDIDSAYDFPWPNESSDHLVGELPGIMPTLERDLATEESGGRRRAALSFIRARSGDLVATVTEISAVNFPRILASLADLEADRGRAGPAQAPNGTDQQTVRLLGLIAALPSGKLVEGVRLYAVWLDVWAAHLKGDARLWVVWRRLWPAAVEQTNRAPVAAQEFSLYDDTQEERNDGLATEALNSAVGHLISALFNVLPGQAQAAHAFDDPVIRSVRDAAFEATGSARLQVLHRFLFNIEYMRLADQPWTQEHLLGPLERSQHQDIAVWDAIARRGLGPESLKLVGTKMAVVARGGSLPVTTRAGLARWVTYSALRDLQAGGQPAIPSADVQQMLRLGGHQVRIAAAKTLKSFLEAKGADPQQQFTPAVGRFLSEIWPSDHTLRSSGLSSALAKIPAAAGAEATVAVRLIADLLTPFDAWNLNAFGFLDRSVNSDGSTSRKVRTISGKKEAAAWLELLDLSIGRGEGAVYPRDLSIALDAIADADHRLRTDAKFHRLIGLARR